MTPISISPFHAYRLTAIPILALLLTHFAVYKKLPFQPDYAFPWLTWGIQIATGLLICQCNYEVYRRLNLVNNGRRNSPTLLFRQFLFGWLATALIFSAAYALILGLFGGAFDGVKFLGYLLLMLGISSMETAVLILRDFYGFLQKRKPAMPSAPVVEKTTGDVLLFNIPSGKKNSASTLFRSGICPFIRRHGHDSDFFRQKNHFRFFGPG